MLRQYRRDRLLPPVFVCARVCALEREREREENWAEGRNCHCDCSSTTFSSAARTCPRGHQEGCPKECAVENVPAREASLFSWPHTGICWQCPFHSQGFHLSLGSPYSAQRPSQVLSRRRRHHPRAALGATVLAGAPPARSSRPLPATHHPPQQGQPEGRAPKGSAGKLRGEWTARAPSRPVPSRPPPAAPGEGNQGPRGGGLVGSAAPAERSRWRPREGGREGGGHRRAPAQPRSPAPSSARPGSARVAAITPARPVRRSVRSPDPSEAPSDSRASASAWRGVRREDSVSGRIVPIETERPERQRKATPNGWCA